MSQVNYEKHFCDLIVAMLAVNSWPLDKVADIYPGLTKQGLTDPGTIVAMKWHAVYTALVKAGYKRGDYIVGLLTERIMEAAAAAMIRGGA